MGNSKGTIQLAARLLLRERIKCSSCDMTQASWSAPPTGRTSYAIGRSFTFFEIAESKGFDDISLPSFVRALRKVETADIAQVLLCPPENSHISSLDKAVQILYNNNCPLFIIIECMNCLHKGKFNFLMGNEKTMRGEG